MKSQWLLGQDHAGSVALSTREIAEVTGQDDRTVQRYVAKLKIRNLLDIENTTVEGMKGYKGPNKYRVIGWPEWMQRV